VCACTCHTHSSTELLICYSLMMWIGFSWLRTCSTCWLLVNIVDEVRPHSHGTWYHVVSEDFAVYRFMIGGSTMFLWNSDMCLPAHSATCQMSSFNIHSYENLNRKPGLTVGCSCHHRCCCCCCCYIQ